MFKNLNYTIIIGPANSNKTSFFLKQLSTNLDKLLISVVDIENLVPLNITKEEFLNLNFCFINLRKFEIINVDYSKKYCVCIDEIHFFDIKDLGLLDNFLKLLNCPEIYFTMLPQSYSNELLKNTHDIFVNTNDIILVDNRGCRRCGKSTVQSESLIDIDQNKSNEPICNKKLFITLCKECKLINYKHALHN
jgi:thymidine kinase